MNLRRILLIAAACLVLIAGGLVLAATLIPEDRVADAVARRAEATLGHPVAIEGVGLSFFPLPGVRLTGLSVGRPDSTALLRLDGAELGVRLLPLLRGRVVISRLELERPRIAVEIDDSTTNIPVIQTDTSADPSSRDIVFSVDGIRVTDGSIRYTNRVDSSSFRLDGWSQELSVVGAVEQGELASLTLVGMIAFDDVSMDLAGAVLPMRDLRLEIGHDAALDLTADRLDLRELAVSFDGVIVDGSGQVEGVNSGRPSVRLQLTADGLDAARLVAWVPDSMRARMTLPDGKELGILGTASLRASVDGTVAPDTLPAVVGALDLINGAVTLGSETILEDVGGHVDFSLDSVVARFDGVALGETFNAGVAVRDPAAPLAVVTLSGRGDLDRLAGLGLVPDSIQLAGFVRVDLRAQVPVRDPAAGQARGSIDVSDVIVAGTEPPFLVPIAATRFEGGQLRVNPFRIELGPDRSVVELDIAASGWIPALVDSTAALPDVTVAIRADTLDLDALLGPSDSGYPPLLFARLRDRSIEGRRPEEIAAEMGLNVPAPPRVDARFEARIDQLVRNELRYSDMEVAARITPEAMAFERVRFGLMGGTVDVNGRLEPVRLDSAGTPVETRLVGRFGLTNVGAAPFFDILTPFRDHLAGTLDMAGTVGMTLDRYALPERSSVQADGTLAISNGRVANWAVLKGVADRLELAAFDTLAFQDWAGTFRITGPRVGLDRTALVGSALDAQANGWFDFGGQLDLAATAALTAELARRAGAIGQQILAASPDGQIPVGLLIRGNVESPNVALDLSTARDAIAGRAREAVQGAARDAEEALRGAAEQVADSAAARAGQAGQELVDRVAERYELPDSLRGLPADSLRQVLGDSVYGLLPDSVKVRADSVQNAIQSALRERLRRMLPGGGGGGGDGRR